MATHSIANLIFNKDLYSISLTDLENFFSEEQEESGILEFKTGDVSVENVYKEVCAFLNTEGGILIIGAPKETVDQNRTFCRGALVPSKFRGKDWLVQKISGNVAPAPAGLRIQEISLTGGNCFIIEVAQSLNPPHQCNNGVYYLRLERDAKPAPHGIVEALFFRRQKPKLKVSMSFTVSDTSQLKFLMTIKNESEYATEKISYTLTFGNVNAVVSDITRFSRLATNSFSTERMYDSALVKFINLNTDGFVTHKGEPFLVVGTAWSKEAKLYQFIGIFDPRSMSFTEESNTDDGNLKILSYYSDKINQLSAN